MKNLIIVFVILLTFICCSTEAERNRMRAGLDSINQRNRNDLPFTVADVKPYVQFFENHGTANDRLLAHYLLGRAYHDHGEAPMALQCYQNAINCADTLSADCDFKQLSRVYAQLANVFYYQGLYRQQLDFHKKAIKYAWTAKDTLAGLMCYEQMSLAYMELKDTTTAMVIIEDVAKKYKELGRNQYSAISLGLAIKPLVNRRNYKKAKEYIDIYESQSGRFDSIGNIETGREIYYGVKGFYFLHTNILDSAEYYFLKELKNGKSYYNLYVAAKGLSMFYQEKHQADSSANYALYACAMLDSVFTQKTTKEVERIQAMYDYTRHQEIARQESEKASIEKRKHQFSLFLLILVVAIATLVIYIMYRGKKKKLSLYIQNLEQLEQLQSEILQLRSHAEEYQELIAMKEKIHEEQSIKIQEQRKKKLQDNAAIDKRIKESSIYNSLLKKQFGQELTIQELRECRKLVLEHLPEFNSLLLSKEYKINVKDFNVCMLFRLGFKSKEISNMLNISQGRVSQICIKVLREVFNKDEGGAAELIEMLHELY